MSWQERATHKDLCLRSNVISQVPVAVQELTCSQELDHLKGLLFRHFPSLKIELLLQLNWEWALSNYDYYLERAFWL